MNSIQPFDFATFMPRPLLGLIAAHLAPGQRERIWDYWRFTDKEEEFSESVGHDWVDFPQCLGEISDKALAKVQTVKLTKDLTPPQLKTLMDLPNVVNLQYAGTDWMGENQPYPSLCTEDELLDFLQKRPKLQVLVFVDPFTDRVAAQLATLAQLSGLSGLGVLPLGGVSKTSFQQVCNIAKLQSLTFKANGLTDEDLMPLAQLTSLTSLEIINGAAISKLTPLKSLTSLRSLLLLFFNKVENESFNDLKFLKKLQTLTLYGCPDFSDNNFAQLNELSCFREITIYFNDQITGEGISLLDKGVLESIHFVGCKQFSTGSFAHWPDELNLKKLSISSCSEIGWHPRMYGHLNRFVGLEHLELTVPLNREALAHLTLLVNLTHLKFKASELLNEVCALKDEDFALLARLRNLESITLDRIPTEGRGLVHLKKLPYLRTLKLPNFSRLTDTNLVHIGAIATLQELELTSCWDVTDDGIAHLRPLLSLEKLTLYSLKEITSESLEYIKHLPIEELNINFCERIKTTELSILAKCISLRVLEYWNWGNPSPTRIEGRHRVRARCLALGLD